MAPPHGSRSTARFWPRTDAAPFAVTALAIDPEDEQIVYAATNVWLGTNTAHLTPLGVAVSVDGGRQWLQLSRAQLGDTPRATPGTGRRPAVDGRDGQQHGQPHGESGVES